MGASGILPGEEEFTCDTMLRLNAMTIAERIHAHRVIFGSKDGREEELMKLQDDALMETANKVYEFIKQGQEEAK